MSPITGLGKRGRRIGAYIKIPLGVGNANALLLKQPPDLVKDLALDGVWQDRAKSRDTLYTKSGRMR